MPTPSPHIDTSLDGSRSLYRSWVSAVVLALGFISVLVLVGTNRIRERVMIQDIAMAKAVNEFAMEITTTHLWLEEYVSGDPHLDPEVIDSSHNRAARLIEMILDGGSIDEGYELESLADNELRLRVSELQELFETFSELKEQRQMGYESDPENVGIGSPIDQEYDDIFHQLLGRLAPLENAVEAGLAAAHARSRFLFRTLLVCWIGVVALALGGLWSYEKRQQRADAALAESRQQLYQAQKMEALGQLAGGIAHDINNYLAAVTAQCELVRMKPHQGDRTAEKMDAVIATAAKASDLIRQLLAYSRRQPVQPQVMSLTRVVTDLLPMMRRLVGEDITLEAILPDDLWPVRMDRSQLEQVVMNLIVNASEAMPRGGKVLVEAANTHRRHAAAGSGTFVALSVADSGVGIPEEIRGRLFEPFFTTKDRASSSGLGLATVYSIAQAAGGDIGLESEVGKGTKFTVFLPRADGTPATEPRATQHKAARGGHRVLLVEDNDDLREATRDALDGFGFTVTANADGYEALATLSQPTLEFDALITDVVMPGMGGKELRERALELHPELPVLLISGYPDDVVLRHGIADATVNFLAKPYSIEQLARKVEEIVAG